MMCRVPTSFNSTSQTSHSLLQVAALLSIHGFSTPRIAWARLTIPTLCSASRNMERVSLTLFDGTTPIAYLYIGPERKQPGNLSWAIFVSSVDRLSSTPSTDPFFSTMASQTPTGTYIVRPRRPALSCWQQKDLWSYKGHSNTIIGLNSTALPGLGMSLGLQLILARYFGTRRIVSTGRLLGSSALLSNATVVGGIFDAQSVSLASDVERLTKACCQRSDRYDALHQPQRPREPCRRRRRRD